MSLRPRRYSSLSTEDLIQILPFALRIILVFHFVSSIGKNGFFFKIFRGKRNLELRANVGRILRPAPAALFAAENFHQRLAMPCARFCRTRSHSARIFRFTHLASAGTLTNIFYLHMAMPLLAKMLLLFIQDDLPVQRITD
jgi:hypothetical protein